MAPKGFTFLFPKHHSRGRMGSDDLHMSTGFLFDCNASSKAPLHAQIIPQICFNVNYLFAVNNLYQQLLNCFRLHAIIIYKNVIILYTYVYKEKRYEFNRQFY